MKLMGMSSASHWMSWIVTSMIKFTVVTTIYIIFMMVKISSNGAILESSDPSLLFFFMICYGIAMTAYACMLSTFLQTGKKWMDGKKEGRKEGRKEMFYLTTYSKRFIYGYMASDIWLRTILIEREKEMFYLMMHSTHFIYGYMASDIWLRTILIVREETCCRHIGYSFRLSASVLLYAPSHRQDSTYHGLCYTSRGALFGTRNSSMGPP